MTQTKQPDVLHDSQTIMTEQDSYADFLDQRSISKLPSPMQLRRWACSKVQAKPRPCRSPYCECELGKCTHPGCYDARHLPLALFTPESFYD